MDDAPYHGRDARPITYSDVESATRGLRIAGMSTQALLETVNTHVAIDMFASAVITVAAVQRLGLLGQNALGMLTDEQLAFVAARTPSATLRDAITQQQELRAAHEAERAKGWLFEVKFSRDYTISESFTRIIRAPSLAEAEAAAERLAPEFNHDVPDDTSEDESGTQETGDFSATVTSAEVHRKTEPDYVVLADGQCVPFEA